MKWKKIPERKKEGEVEEEKGSNGEDERNDEGCAFVDALPD